MTPYTWYFAFIPFKNITEYHQFFTQGTCIIFEYNNAKKFREYKIVPLQIRNS